MLTLCDGATLATFEKYLRSVVVEDVTKRNQLMDSSVKEHLAVDDNTARQEDDLIATRMKRQQRRC